VVARDNRVRATQFQSVNAEKATASLLSMPAGRVFDGGERVRVLTKRLIAVPSTW